MVAHLLLLGLLAAPPPGEALARGIASGEVRLLFCGDSITYGQGLEDPELDSFAALTRAALAARAADAAVSTELVAFPGATASWALAYLGNRALVSRPHLAVIQLGGNDSAATGTVTLERFREDLSEIVGRLRESGSDVIILIQPFNMTERAEREGRFIEAMRAVAAEQGAAVADGHGRMAAEPHDRRGWFPFAGWGHPNWYGHRLMAEELWAAVGELWPEAGRLRIRIEPWTAFRGWPGEVPLTLSVSGGEPGPVRLDVWIDGELVGSTQVQLGPEGTGTGQVQLPGTGPMGARRIWVTGRGGGQFGATAGRLGTRWALALPAGPPNVAEPGNAGGTLGAANLTSGYVAWSGEADCSGTFALGREGDTLVLEVAVRDDAIHPSEGWAPDGDCVEVALDLNPAERWAMPYFTERNLVLFVTAPEEGGVPRVSFMDEDLPIADVSVTGTVGQGGYQVRLSLPLASLGLAEGETSIGLDVAIDDCDGPPWRQTQLVWSGGWDMALTGESCARIDLTGAVPPDTRWITVR